MFVYILAFLMGIVTGLRSMTAPAAVSWAARLGWLRLENTPLAFMGFAAAPYIWSVLALGELIVDKLPQAPSRKALLGFTGRVCIGALCGASIALGTPAAPALNSSGTGISLSHSWVAGAIAGILGAVAGTLGGYEFRLRLVKATGGRDFPIALLEDAIALVGAFLVISSFR